MNLKGRVANFLTRRESEVEIINALKNVSISVRDGDRIGIVGPNGAGKTTLLRVMAGILQPSQGKVEIQGSIVSMIDQGLGLDPQCSGLENIFRRGIFLNQSNELMKKRVNDIVEFSGLGNRIRHPLYTYSSGMKARLAFSIVTSIKPQILIIDEGIGAADMEFSNRASARLNDFLNNAGILLIATHSRELIDQWSTTQIALCNGSIKNTD